jgi:formylglycine-generating enzyme required for sulfatase activity
MRLRGKAVHFTPNTWGLYQVHGNAFEWVEDCWNESYQNAPSGDAASLTGNCSRHVRRGGAWNFIPATLRSAYRDSRPAMTRGSNTGLRVARWQPLRLSQRTLGAEAAMPGRVSFSVPTDLAAI